MASNLCRVLSAVLLLGAGTLTAQSVSFPIPLTYNFNGIVHAGEMGVPDDPNGFRSISDRALDFTAGVPANPLLTDFSLVSSAGMLDIVHLGNRNTVDFGNRTFDVAPDGDDIGIQPNWLPNPDQSGPQTSLLGGGGIPIAGSALIRFLYQISNGGGSFDVTINLASGNTVTQSLSGSDWFGGVFPGTGFTDSGLTDANLSITEGTIDLSTFAPDTIDSITFSNPSNTNAGYAILAATATISVPPSRVNQIPLNYNFNGIVHVGESGLPDDLNGYRSISDRGLSFEAGIPVDPILEGFLLVDQPGVVDIVHIGNRNTVDGGNRPFDLVANANDLGVQPSWLPNPDQTGPQTTVLQTPILLDPTSFAAILFQVSNGGGNLDVTLGFQSGVTTTSTVTAGDWFGGSLPGTQNTDSGVVGANLNVQEARIDLNPFAGQILTSVTFENPSNANAGYAVLALNVAGCISCANSAAITDLGGSNGPTLQTTSNGNVGCDIEYTVTGADGSGGFAGLAIGIGPPTVPLPLGLAFGGCAGEFFVPSPNTFNVTVDSAGSAQLVVRTPPDPGICGGFVTAQFAQIVTAPCPVLLSNGLTIQFGN